MGNNTWNVTVFEGSFPQTIRCDGSNSCQDISKLIMRYNYTYTPTDNYSGGIYCTAFGSCSESNIYMLPMESSSSGNIDSSYDTYINTNTWLSLYCTGNRACVELSIKNAKYVYCTGYQACLHIDIMDVESIFVFGSEAISSGSTSLLSNVRSNLYCGTTNACTDVNVLNVSNVYAYGYQSLIDSTVYNVSGSIVAIGYQAMVNTQISNNYSSSGHSYQAKLECNGRQSCENTTITGISNITVNGYNGLNNAIITSQVNTNFNICLHSNYTNTQIMYDSDTNNVFELIVNNDMNQNSTIYCNSTDICYIRCQSSNACQKVHLYCFGVCLISCDYTCPNIVRSQTLAGNGNVSQSNIIYDTSNSIVIVSNHCYAAKTSTTLDLYAVTTDSPDDKLKLIEWIQQIPIEGVIILCCICICVSVCCFAFGVLANSRKNKQSKGKTVCDSSNEKRHRDVSSKTDVHKESKRDKDANNLEKEREKQSDKENKFKEKKAKDKNDTSIAMEKQLAVNLFKLNVDDHDNVNIRQKRNDTLTISDEKDYMTDSEQLYENPNNNTNNSNKNNKTRTGGRKSSAPHKQGIDSADVQQQNKEKKSRNDNHDGEAAAGNGGELPHVLSLSSNNKPAIRRRGNAGAGSAIFGEKMPSDFSMLDMNNTIHSLSNPTLHSIQLEGKLGSLRSTKLHNNNSSAAMIHINASGHRQNINSNINLSNINGNVNGNVNASLRSIPSADGYESSLLFGDYDTRGAHGHGHSVRRVVSVDATSPNSTDKGDWTRILKNDYHDVSDADLKAISIALNNIDNKNDKANANENKNEDESHEEKDKSNVNIVYHD